MNFETAGKKESGKHRRHSWNSNPKPSDNASDILPIRPQEPLYSLPFYGVFTRTSECYYSGDVLSVVIYISARKLSYQALFKEFKPDNFSVTRTSFPSHPDLGAFTGRESSGRDVCVCVRRMYIVRACQWVRVCACELLPVFVSLPSMSLAKASRRNPKH